MRILTDWVQPPGKQAILGPGSRSFAVMASCIMTTSCIIGLTGCSASAQFERISPGSIAIGDCLTLVPTIAWSGSPGEPEMWTQDGPALQALYLFKGIEEGNPLIPQRARRESRLVFRNDMTAHEIVELVEDSLAQVGMAKIRTTNLRPHPLGPTEGIHFTLAYVSPSGLDGRAMGIGAVILQRLVVVLYTGIGPFYAAYEPYAKALLESTRLRPDCGVSTTGATPLG